MAEDKHRKKADALFGQIALKLGIITRKQLEEALAVQRTSNQHKPLGLILMDLKYVSERDLERIIEAQKAIASQAESRAKAVREDTLFGKVAIRLGLCSEEQLAECLVMQEQLPKDRFMRLGDIMVIKGVLTVDQVRKILDTQRGLILYCPQCDTQYNVVMFRPGASIQCYRCGTALRIPARMTSEEEALRSEE
ncbi:MAG: hypothetical protein HYY16_02670 [Planctomycetes bacterium]|nr:hypothetical protein [Planctomycetota bacterium]